MFETHPLDMAGKFSAAALKRLAELQIPPSPIYYAVMYAYYSLQLPEINEAIDATAGAELDITPDLLDALYGRYLGTEREREVLRQSGETMTGEIKNIEQLIESVSGNTNRYGAALDQFSDQLSEDISPEDLQKTIERILGETNAMAKENESLHDQLQTTFSQMDELKARLETVRQEALTDPLTGVANRKAFNAQLADGAASAIAEDGRISLLMIDIDHFKQFNDKFGHSVGDHVLKLVAKTLRDNLKGRDMIARYGGEEFAVILNQTSGEQALQVGNMLRNAIANKHVIRRPTNESLGAVTISVGVAEFGAQETLQHWVERADQALYTAKKTGRNRVVMAEADLVLDPQESDSKEEIIVAEATG